MHSSTNRGFFKLRDKRSCSCRRTGRTKAEVETEDLEVRELGVGVERQSASEFGNRRRIVALILPGIRNEIEVRVKERVRLLSRIMSVSEDESSANERKCVCCGVIRSARPDVMGTMVGVSNLLA
jgi:hypothetical protein